MIPQEKYIYKKSQGNCMMPVICPNDALVIKSARDVDFDPGDVVAFNRGGNLFAHRLIKIIRNQKRIVFLTKGDRDLFIEQPVEYDWVIGKVVAVNRADNIIAIDNKKMGFYNKFLFYWLAVYYFFAATINSKYSFRQSPDSDLGKR
ncbi:MAG: S24/S26 family peptidase [Candidatus Omnitrophica bacterium]|nr:S24/S26 family peptidase [Candidatus Omnitrophota bacterium]